MRREGSIGAATAAMTDQADTRPAEASISSSVPAWTVVREVPSAYRRGPRLLEVVRERIRTRHLSRRTEQAYVGWIQRYVLFHEKRHPRDLGGPDVVRFLSWLAVEGLEETVRAKRPGRLPVILTREEVGLVLVRLGGTPRLMVALLYGAGLRLLECARLRVKNPARSFDHPGEMRCSVDVLHGTVQ